MGWTLASPLPAVGGKICRALFLLLPPIVYWSFQILFDLNYVFHSICSGFHTFVGLGSFAVSYIYCSWISFILGFILLVYLVLLPHFYYLFLCLHCFSDCLGWICLLWWLPIAIWFFGYWFPWINCLSYSSWCLSGCWGFRILILGVIVDCLPLFSFHSLLFVGYYSYTLCSLFMNLFIYFIFWVFLEMWSVFLTYMLVTVFCFEIDLVFGFFGYLPLFGYFFVTLVIWFFFCENGRIWNK